MCAICLLIKPLTPVCPSAPHPRMEKVTEPKPAASHISPCHHLAITQRLSLSKKKEKLSESSPYYGSGSCADMTEGG